MYRKKSKSKVKSFKVKFSGRFKCTKDQINAYAAFQLLRFCNKKKDSAKTELVFNSKGFYVGKSISFMDIKKKTFYNVDIQDFFIFKESPHCTIIVEKEHDNLWMSYFKFEDDSDADEFVKYLQDNINATVGEDDELENGDIPKYDRGLPNVTTMTLNERIGLNFARRDSSSSSLPSYRSRTTGINEQYILYENSQLNHEHDNDPEFKVEPRINEEEVKFEEAGDNDERGAYISVKFANVRPHEDEEDTDRGNVSDSKSSDESDHYVDCAMTNDNEKSCGMTAGRSISNEEGELNMDGDLYITVVKGVEVRPTTQRYAARTTVTDGSSISSPRRTRISNFSDIYMHAINGHCQKPLGTCEEEDIRRDVVDNSLLMICQRKSQSNQDTPYSMCDSD